MFCVAKYNQCLSNILDKHASIRHHKISIRPKHPWFNKSLQLQRSNLRKVERKWRKTRNISDHAIFTTQLQIFSNLLVNSKAEYYQNIICEHKNDQENLSEVTKALLQQVSERSLPPYKSDADLSNDFGNSFIIKINRDLNLIVMK